MGRPEPTERLAATGGVSLLTGVTLCWKCLWIVALVSVPREVIWLLCPQEETSQAPLDCSQNPSYYRGPHSFLLAHQLHLLAAQGRPKRLAKGRA